MSNVVDANRHISDYMIYLYDQVFNASNILPNERPMIVYIDTKYNQTNLSNVQMKYALKQMSSVIHSQFSLLSPTALIVFPIIYAVIILVGLITNALMVIAFYRAEKLRTFRNVFIINLAISDILLCLICAPLTLLKYIELNWILGRVLCKCKQICTCSISWLYWLY